MSGGFQTQVYSQPAAAVAGNRASQNPLFSYDAGPGGLVAGSSLFVGRFAWVTQPLDANGTPSIANSFGSGAPSGFVMNQQQALNTTFLSNAGMQIQSGYQCALQIAGDFWVVNSGSGEAVYGMKAYANLADGTVTFAATGSPTQAASVTASVAASIFSVTGSITGDVLTVTAVGSGTVVNGGTISGIGIATGTQIVSQLSGTAGGIGTYRVSIPEQAVASTTVSGTYGTMTVTAVGSGALAVNQIISGSGVVAGTTITALGTGTGGTGTYIVNNNTVVGSTTITSNTNVETKFFARSSGLNGETHDERGAGDQTGRLLQSFADGLRVVPGPQVGLPNAGKHQHFVVHRKAEQD